MKALVIDDQLSILESMKYFFDLRGWQVETAPTGGQGLVLARESNPDLVVLDIKLPDLDGLVVLERLRAQLPETQVIMVTAYQDMENTISSIKLGAYDFIHKPIDINEMDAALERLAEERGARGDRPDTGVAEPEPQADSAPLIVGKSRAMKEVYKTIAMVSESRVTVLILGESGTGKELIARAIHHQSSFRSEPFMVTDCSTLVDNLVESDLFGYEKGAFTGAENTRKGRLELAGHGSIFFDEIGEMPLNLQSKLLRFLQEREVYRVGGAHPIRSDARVLAATNRDLKGMVKDGSLRQDLYYRLKVVTIQVPPLRERRSDIPLLCSHLLNKIGGQTGTAVKRLSPDALQALTEFPWPGNVRQLENTLTRAAVLTKSPVLTKQLLAPALYDDDTVFTENAPLFSLAKMEHKHIARVLKFTRGHLGNACKILGISRPTLRSKMNQYGLHGQN